MTVIMYRGYDYDEDDKSIPSKRHVVVPGCCKASTKHLTTVLWFEDAGPDDEEYDDYNPNRPIWVVSQIERASDYVGWQYDTDYTQKTETKDEDGFISESYESIKNWDKIEVKCCPFCATPLPKLKKVKDENSKESTHSGTVDYCSTCQERNRNCRCWHPTINWEPDWSEDHKMIVNC